MMTKHKPLDENLAQDMIEEAKRRKKIKDGELPGDAVKEDDSDSIHQEDTPENEKAATLDIADRSINIAFVFTLLIVIARIVYTIIDAYKVGAPDGYAIIDIVLLICMSIGLFKKSRMAALSVAAYYIVGKVLDFVGGYDTLDSGIVFTIIIVVLYLKAVQGTFQYHKALGTKKFSVWEIILGVVTGLLLLIGILGTIYGG